MTCLGPYVSVHTFSGIRSHYDELSRTHVRDNPPPPILVLNLGTKRCVCSTRVATVPLPEHDAVRALLVSRLQRDVGRLELLQLPHNCKYTTCSAHARRHSSSCVFVWKKISTLFMLSTPLLTHDSTEHSKLVLSPSGRNVFQHFHLPDPNVRSEASFRVRVLLG